MPTTTVHMNIHTHQHVHDNPHEPRASTRGAFTFSVEEDDDGNTIAVEVFRDGPIPEGTWGRYTAHENDTAWDAAIKATVCRLECEHDYADKAHDPAPLWVFLDRHEAQVIPLSAHGQTKLITISKWDPDAEAWRRSDSFDWPDTARYYTEAWQTRQALLVEKAALRYVEKGCDGLPPLDAPWAPDQRLKVDLPLYDLYMAVTQWGDRDESSWKHIATGIRAILDGRHWHEVDECKSPGGLFGTDDEATQAITARWESLEKAMRKSAGDE